MMQPTEVYTPPAAPAGVAERGVEKTRLLPRNQERLLTVGPEAFLGAFRAATAASGDGGQERAPAPREN